MSDDVKSDFGVRGILSDLPSGGQAENRHPRLRARLERTVEKLEVRVHELEERFGVESESPFSVQNVLTGPKGEAVVDQSRDEPEEADDAGRRGEGGEAGNLGFEVEGIVTD